MHFVLIGNYGVGNLGDEALREYFETRFPQVQWSVVSARPTQGEFPRLPFGIRSLFQPWWRTLRALRKSDGLVFGGGSLFTDIESPKACMLWWFHAYAAYLFGKPFFLAFQGIGPVRSGIGARCARWVLRRASYISVRDQASADRVLKLVNRKVIQYFDPVLDLIEEKKVESGSQKVFSVIPRKNSGAPLRNRALALFPKPWESVQVLSLEPGNSEEWKICELLSEQLRARFVPIHSLDDLCREVAASGLVLSQRYHGALAAWALGVPVELVPQGPGDKLAELDLHANPTAMRELVTQGQKALQDALGIHG